MNDISQAVKKIVANPALLHTVEEEDLDALSLLLSMHFQELYRAEWSRSFYDDTD